MRALKHSPQSAKIIKIDYRKIVRGVLKFKRLFPFKSQVRFIANDITLVILVVKHSIIITIQSVSADIFVAVLDFVEKIVKLIIKIV